MGYSYNHIDKKVEKQERIFNFIVLGITIVTFILSTFGNQY